MKHAAFFLAGAFLFCLAGCAQKPGIEGRLLDCQGKPLAGVTVVASQARPLLGYERFETVSGQDGSFAFSGLYPSSVYVLRPQSEKWATGTELSVESGPRGETALVPDGLRVRFMRHANGLILDSETGLEWVAGPDKDMSWGDAKTWAESLDVSGKGWRMPAIKELLTLIVPARTPFPEDEVLLDPAFGSKAASVWSADLSREQASDTELADCLQTSGGTTRQNDISTPDLFDMRALAVRARK